MAYENIILEKADGVATITFNRPEAMNALNNRTRSEFAEAIRDVAGDEEVKVLIAVRLVEAGVFDDTAMLKAATTNAKKLGGSALACAETSMSTTP